MAKGDALVLHPSLATGVRAIGHRILATRSSLLAGAAAILLAIYAASAYRRGTGLGGIALGVLAAIAVLTVIAMVFTAIYFLTSWVYVANGKVGMVTLLTRREYQVSDVAKAVRCSITSASGTPERALVILSRPNRSLFWLYLSVWNQTQIDSLLSGLGVVPEGSWQDQIPWNQMKVRFPPA